MTASGKNPKKAKIPADIAETFKEILKWGLVLFLMWPMVTLKSGHFSLPRVLGGIVLFVIFSGKLLYDYMIKDMIRQRQRSMKQDMAAFFGILLVAAIFVGVVILMFALFIMQGMNSSDPVQPQ